MVDDAHDLLGGEQFVSGMPVQRLQFVFQVAAQAYPTGQLIGRRLGRGAGKIA